MDTRNFYKTKVTLALLLAFVWMLWLVVPATATAQSEDPYRIEEFTIAAPGELDVQTSGGHITVEGSETSTVRVEMFVRQNGRNLTPSDTDLDEFEINIEQNGNYVEATARRTGGNRWFNRHGNNISVSFVVYTPRQMNTELRTSGGHIETVNLKGEQSIRTSGGHLVLNELNGKVSARTSGGHIEITDFMGEMQARTSGGHIKTRGSEGILDLHTSGGHITLDEISGTLDARTSGGSINADLQSIDRYAELRTSGGHITITVPEGLGLDLNLRGTRVSTHLSNFTGDVERNEITGMINGGGPKLSARTSGGSVRIKYQ